MAFIFTDGYDSYAASSDLTKKYASLSNTTLAWNATAGRLGGGGLTGASSATQSLLATPATLTTIGSSQTHFGFWCKISGNPAANLPFIGPGLGGSFYTSLVLVSNGTLALWNWNSSIFGSTFVITDNLWHWVEVQASYTNTSQAHKLTIDGVNYINGTNNWNGGTGVLNPQFMYVAWGGTTGSTLNGFDDFIVYDNNGNQPIASSYPLGPRLISTIRPGSDSAIQFTPDTGASNFSQVNEVVADDDAHYVQDSASGHQDLYNYDSLGFTPSTITGVMLNSRLKNMGAGAINYQVIGNSGGTQKNGTSVTAPSNYQTNQLEFGVDPNTSAAWTAANLNAAKFGIKIP
jgi:hypothetical protein